MRVRLRIEATHDSDSASLEALVHLQLNGRNALQIRCTHVFSNDAQEVDARNAKY